MRWLFFVIILSFLVSPGRSQDIYLAYPFGVSTSRGVPPGRIVSVFGVGGINDSIDVLNLKSRELKRVSRRAGSLGDYSFLRFDVVYGLSKDWNVEGSLEFSSLDYGYRTLDVKSYNLALRHHINSWASLEIGYRMHSGEDQDLDRVDEINDYLSLFRSGLSMEVEPSFIWFIRRSGGTVDKVKVRRTEDPFLRVYSLDDKTWWIKLVLGSPFDSWYPNIFLEYGRTSVNTKITSNLPRLIPERYRDRLPKLPLDLGRDEEYVRAGFSAIIYLPLGIFFSFEYSYTHLFRDSDLDYVSYNHRLQFRFYRHIVGPFSGYIGAVYLQRQFNGELPFLYNRYSQTTFDHRYGWMELGVVLFSH